MKIVLLIDHLGSGGAQRQLCVLAKLLSEDGHSVTIVNYQDHDFFATSLEQTAVERVVLPPAGKLKRIAAVRSTIRGLQPDVVCAYLHTPSILASLSRMLDNVCPVVVSERGLVDNESGLGLHVRMNLFRFTDTVLCNSQTQRDSLIARFPRLAKKVCVIPNCVDLDQFSAQDLPPRENHRRLRIGFLGSYSPWKNLHGLFEAFESMPAAEQSQLHFECFGKHFCRPDMADHISRPYRELMDRLKTHPLREQFEVNDPTNDVMPIYRRIDALCLPSISDAFPNVVGEAMSCGLPILASRVGDVPTLVAHRENGLLFDPEPSSSISAALIQFVNLSDSDRQQMGHESRSRAERILSPSVFLQKHCELFGSLVDSRTARKGQRHAKAG